MLRAILLFAWLSPLLLAQRDVRYYFNGRERVQLEEIPPGQIYAWRIRANSYILSQPRPYERRMYVFRSMGVNSDALALMRDRPLPPATAELFGSLKNSQQAQPLRVFRRLGSTIPLIEFPQIYAKLRPGVTAASLRQSLIEKGYLPGNVRPGLHGWVFLDLENPHDTLALAADLNGMPSLVSYAEPVLLWVLNTAAPLIVPPDLPPADTPLPAGSPNDTFFPRQWALFQPFGISILPAWQSTAPANQVRVAVLDAPIDLAHPDLRPALDIDAQFNATAVVNEDTTRLAYNPDPLRRSDHGTACAGIIAAVRGNGFGVAGVAPNVRILPVQILRQDAGADILSPAAISQGILYALDKGADVISLSANIERITDTRSIEDALEEIQVSPKRVVFINSTGNDPDGNATGVGFPASFADRYQFLIGVGASDRCGSLKRKNFSPTTCDLETNWQSRSDELTGTLLAPGLDIVTTTNVRYPAEPANRLNYRKNFSGTSAAAPFVTGVAALLLSTNQSLTAAQVRQRLFDLSDRIPDTRHRRLNACKALAICAVDPN